VWSGSSPPRAPWPEPVDARERLRRYLEQRRELGESELVLDGLSVDDVLKVVGARPGMTAARPASAAPPAPPPPFGLVSDEFAAPADHPRLHGDGPPGVQDLPPSTPHFVPVQEASGDAAPPADAPERVDWRAALRAADAAPVAPGRSTRPADAGTGAPTGSPEDDVARRAGGAGGDKPPAAVNGGPAAGAPAAGAPFPGTDIPTGLVVGGAAGELFGGPLGELRTLEEIAATVHACTRCPLYKTATHGVPGEGHPDADFMVVGEAPGAEEDATGRPFVGASGQLLTKILAAINLRREDVFIANVVKHRPPGNRNPAPDEVAACSPYLIRQIEIVRPRVILTVGNFAAQTLLDTKLGIGKLRGQVHVYHGVPLIATYHPAALLRNPAWKRPTWEDVQLARRLFDRAAPG